MDKHLQNSLSLKELIFRVQQELVESQAEREARGEDALFQVEKLVLEVNFVVTQSMEGKGGLEFKVLTLGGVNIGGNKGYQQQQVHKITLSLTVAPHKTKTDKSLVTNGEMEGIGKSGEEEYHRGEFPSGPSD